MLSPTRTPSHWQIAAHASALPNPGDFVTAELTGGTVLVLRDQQGTVRAFRNLCAHGHHALVVRASGQLRQRIECPIHGLAWDLRGAAVPERGRTGLTSLQVQLQQGLIMLCTDRASEAAEAPSLAWGPELALRPAAAPQEFEVQAPWQMLAEQWLEFELPERPLGRLAGMFTESQRRVEEQSGRILWRARLDDQASSWYARRYTTLARHSAVAEWHRLFLPPNQYIERREDGLSVLQVIPRDGSQSRLRWLEYRASAADRRLLAMSFLARRLRASWLAADIGAVQSALRFGRFQPAGLHFTHE